MLHIALVILLTAIAWVIWARSCFSTRWSTRCIRRLRHPRRIRSTKGAEIAGTLALITAINILKCSCYAAVYLIVVPCLPAAPAARGALFGIMLTLTRMIPGDVDRAFLTTYPATAAWIEFAIFTIGVFFIAMCYAFFL